MRSSTPPWPGRQVSGILHASRALERRFGQVAHLRGHIHHDGHHQPVPPDLIGERELGEVPVGEFDRKPEQPPVTSTLPTTEPIAPAQVLFGLIAGASLCVPQHAADIKRNNVARPNGKQQKNNQRWPIGLLTQGGDCEEREADVAQRKDGGRWSRS